MNFPLRLRATAPILLILFADALPAQSAADGFRADLQTVARELPARHPNLFFARSRSDWQAEIDRLDTDLPNLPREQFLVRLASLIAGQRDAHTSLILTGLSGFPNLPIEFRVFSDGIYVTAAPPGRPEVLRARLLGIADADVNGLLSRFRTVISSENDFWFRDRMPSYLRNLGVLRGLALAGATASFRLQLESGTETILTLGDPGNPVPALAPGDGFLPSLARRPGENYWFEYLAAERVLYFRYAACSEQPSRPFAPFADEMLQVLDRNPVDRIIVDLRQNGGGNQALALPLFLGFAARIGRLRIANPDFRVLALSDGGTFSSAMGNVADLKLRDIPAEFLPLLPPGAQGIGAEQWGEPTGGKPYAYGEVQSFRLPSGAVVSYSTRYLESYPIIPDRDAIYPEVPIGTRSTDYFSRHDPVLAAAVLGARTPAPTAPGGEALTVNSASFRVESGIAPNSWASAFGNFGASDNVNVNGVQAPVAAASPGQMVFLVPPGTNTGTVQIEVRESALIRARGSFEVTATGPGLFIANVPDRSQPGAILNQDGALNTRANPARPGQVLQIFGTGRGSATAPRVWVGQVRAEVAFSGDTGPGLWQLNVRVPAGATFRGQVPVVVEAGGRISNPATVWVEP